MEKIKKTVRGLGIPFQRKRCKSKKLKKVVLPLLRGHVFHVTSKEGIQGIIADGKIRNNKTGELSCRDHMSKGSYGRLKGWVNLVDLRSVTGQLTDDAAFALQYQYDFLNPPCANNNPFFLILSKESYPQLAPIPTGEARIGAEGKFILVERHYPGDIPIDKIVKIIEVRVRFKKRFILYASTAKDFAEIASGNCRARFIIYSRRLRRLLKS